MPTLRDDHVRVAALGKFQQLNGVYGERIPCDALSWSLAWRGDVLEAGFGHGDHFPQYLAIHADSGFLRLNGGSDSNWGTSIVVLPSLWEDGQYHQGAPISVASKISQSTLILSFSASLAHLHVLGKVRLRQPEADGIACDVWVKLEGDVRLDRRQREAFKPVFASSMHVSDELWDVESIRIDSRPFAIPERGWVIKPVTKGRRIILNGGSSRWKRRAPSVEIELDDCMEIAGWKTPSTNPDDDNIGVWAAADHVMRGWHYVIRART
jgi:hypothetical protein